MNVDDGSVVQRGRKMLDRHGWRVFLKRGSMHAKERLFGRTRMHFFRKQFMKRMVGKSNLEELSKFLYNFRHLGLTMQPFQQPKEILEFMILVKGTNPHAILEIGLGYGGTLLLFERAASSDAKILGLDLPPRILTIGCPRWRERLIRDLATDHQAVVVIRGNSHNDATLRSVREELGDSLLDVLFIDGDHSYDGVRRDFEMYSPLVRRGGIVGFHDIIPNMANPDIGVPRYWSELKVQYRHREFSEETHRNGIGVVFLD